MRTLERSRLLKIGLFAGFVGCTVLMAFSQTLEISNAFDIANGFLVVFFLQADRRWAVTGAIAASAVNIVLMALFYHLPFSHVFLGGSCNIVEALIAAMLTKRLCGSEPDFSRLAVLARFAFLCVLPAATIGMAVISLNFVFELQNLRWQVVLQNIAGDFSGIMIIAPGLWTIINQSAERRFQKSAVESVALYGLLFLCEIGLFAQSSLPALFVVFPFLVAISFRLGPVGASYGIMGTGLIAAVATVLGFGPFSVSAGAGWGTHFLLQLFVLTASFTALPAAGSVSEKLRANAALTKAQASMRNLLNNTDQGFLTIGADLLVGEEFSAACEPILGETPARKPIVELLCRDAAPETAATMGATLQSVFREADDFIRELKLGLLPSTLNIGEKSVGVGYKLIEDGRSLMLVLTDTTETTLLTETVERERKRLEMIVLAFTEGEAFSALVNDYRTFVSAELPLLIQQVESGAAIAELYRHLHTYKGLLAQFSFHASPRQIHAYESKLAARSTWTVTAAQEAFAPDVLIGELERDLDGLSDIVGSDFLTTRRRKVLSQQQLQEMEQIAKDTLAGDGVDALAPALRRLLRTLAELGRFDVKSALALHSKGAVSLSERLEKQLAPIVIGGDDATLPPDRYGAFFRSLVHLFRNAVDHGIESPEEREASGKPVEGTITCSVRDYGDALEIVVEDDGAGIDRRTLENKLAAMGVDQAQIARLSLADLVFREGLSSRSAASDISGRGIGLAAVKAELDRLGGSITVETEEGAGTRFRFLLTTTSDAQIHQAA